MDYIDTVFIRLPEIMLDHFFLLYANECSAVGRVDLTPQYVCACEAKKDKHILSMALFPFFNVLFYDVHHLCVSCQEVCPSPFVCVLNNTHV